MDISWVAEFAPELASLATMPKNQTYFGTYVWKSSTSCFALSFGKTHFYLREFCDTEFGLEMARRICDRDDVRQKAARRYAGQRKKEIRSYKKETQIDIESGESIDYLQAATIEADRWGQTAKFGASMLVAPTLEHEALPDFMNQVEEELAKPPLFELPRTEVVRDVAEIERFDSMLVADVMNENAEFEESSHQLVGVDFIFSGNQEYSFYRYRAKSSTFTQLSIGDLRQFVQDNEFGLIRY